MGRSSSCSPHFGFNSLDDELLVKKSSRSEGFKKRNNNYRPNKQRKDPKNVILGNKVGSLFFPTWMGIRRN